ncbi:hypothetical protein FOL47_005202, partial [Perkinsus chesapeaki]
YARAVTRQDHSEDVLGGEPCDDDDVVPEQEGAEYADSEEEFELEESTPSFGNQELQELDIPQQVTPHTLDALEARFDEALQQQDPTTTCHEHGTAQAVHCSPATNVAPTQVDDKLEQLSRSHAESAQVSSDWVKLDVTSSGKVPSKRNVARRRSLGGSLVEVRPDFNTHMKDIWTDIWSHLGASSGGKSLSQMVWSLLSEYNRR